MRQPRQKSGAGRYVVVWWGQHGRAERVEPVSGTLGLRDALRVHSEERYVFRLARCVRDVVDVAAMRHRLGLSDEATPTEVVAAMAEAGIQPRAVAPV